MILIMQSCTRLYLGSDNQEIFDEAIQPDELGDIVQLWEDGARTCLLYTSPSPRDRQKSRMPSSA